MISMSRSLAGCRPSKMATSTCCSCARRPPAPPASRRRSPGNPRAAAPSPASGGQSDRSRRATPAKRQREEPQGGADVVDDVRCRERTPVRTSCSMKSPSTVMVSRGRAPPTGSAEDPLARRRAARTQTLELRSARPASALDRAPHAPQVWSRTPSRAAPATCPLRARRARRGGLRGRHERSRRRSARRAGARGFSVQR